MQASEKKEILKKIGSRLKMLREERNIAPKEIAFALKITTQQYGNLETGKSAIDICKLIELAGFLKISLQVLLNLEYSLIYNNTVSTNQTGSVIQGNNTVNHFVEKEYLEFLKGENIYLKEKLDGLLAGVSVKF